MLCIFVVICICINQCIADTITIKAPIGPIVGTRGPHSSEFLGIPFAEPPSGPLRFQPPVPKRSWNTPLNATVFGPGCPQHCVLPPYSCPTVQSEDCLQLNIFTPSTASSSARLPVVVFLPGGNFRQGAASTLIYDSRLWANATNVIVVTTNYRLGALGFLVQSNVPYNLGIMDQRVALQWVADNIGAFGGDPSRITLMGQSAGATSIGYHLLSPKSVGLFHRVVSQSNPLALPLKNPKDGETEGNVFMKHLGCSQGNFTCLQSKSVSDIIAAEVLTNKHFFPFHPFLLFYPWTPVVDVANGVDRQPIAGLMEGHGMRVPGIFGTVANESLIFIYQAFGAKGMSTTMYEAFVADAFPLHVVELLRRYPPSMGGNASMAASYLATDFLFTCPTRALVRARSALPNSSTFLYKFDHPISFGKKMWGDNPECFYETCHAGELLFIFDPLRDAPGFTFTPQEVVISHTLQNYWGNFFATGDVSNGDLSVPVKWTPYQTSLDNNVRITSPASFMQSGLKKYECDYFDKVGYDRGETFINALKKAIIKSNLQDA